MKSIVVRKLKEYGYSRILGKKLESYNFYTLVHFLEMVEAGDKLK